MAVFALAGDQITAAWPSASMQALNYVVLCISLLVSAIVVGRRAEHYPVVFLHPKPHSSAWICDVALLLTLADALFFCVTAGLVQFGLGMAAEDHCQSAILLCVTAYGLVKVFLFLWLLERVFVVQGIAASGTSWIRRRLRSKVYVGGLLLYLTGLPTVALFIISRISFMTDEVCHIGISTNFGLPMVIWDVCINCYLTSAFAWPLLTANASSRAHLRALTMQSFVGAAVSSGTTLANLITLIVLGEEFGFVCLMCCSADVLINSLTLSLITRNRYVHRPDNYPSDSARTPSNIELDHTAAELSKPVADGIQVTRSQCVTFDLSAATESDETQKYPVRLAPHGSPRGGDKKGLDPGSIFKRPQP